MVAKYSTRIPPTFELDVESASIFLLWSGPTELYCNSLIDPMIEEKIKLKWETHLEGIYKGGEAQIRLCLYEYTDNKIR